ncbi:MAG: HD domain-containing protein [Eubacteriales bacterium]|nr:HD domain-containing protein [Eubacteriales bacterium]
MTKLDELTLSMIRYESGCPQRVQHLLKVHAFAALIASMEELPSETRFVLEAAALVHDIGIRPALKKYGHCAGAVQEAEGGAPARAMLEELNFPENVTNRVVYLVEHHHTYAPVDGMDHRILLEADFLVNLHEGNETPAAIQTAYEKVFCTRGGRQLCREMFALA